ncbi:uncharacterized protein LOC143899533 isoform X4 [Temnothorax americanus]|uniref:uncharacterized protein LOC143899533 isoform X4 n=1 Tax=Temnothorax americanus TaxID=1964332 RepID=UPI0040693808
MVLFVIHNITRSRARGSIYVNEYVYSACPMRSDETDIEEQRRPQPIPGPPQLPPLIKGQKLKSGPYTVTVTDEMVAQRERENLELYKAWVREQRRRNMLPQEEADEFIGDFKDVIVRRSFVRKVFCLLTLQLMFTILVISIFMFVDEAQKFMMVHWYLWIVAMVFFIVAYCAIACSVHARQTPPFNYICLFLLVRSLGIFFFSSQRRDTSNVVPGRLRLRVLQHRGDPHRYGHDRRRHDNHSSCGNILQV